MNELQHHGILGMKWGVRRYQNSDGSLTPAGQKRKQKQEKRETKKIANDRYKDAKQRLKRDNGAVVFDYKIKKGQMVIERYMDEFGKEYNIEDVQKYHKRRAAKNTALILGAIGGVTIPILLSS